MKSIQYIFEKEEKEEKEKALSGLLFYILSIALEYTKTHEDSSEVESYLKDNGYLEDLKETNFTSDKTESDDDIIKQMKKMIDKLYKADSNKIDESYNTFLLEEKEEKEKAIKIMVDAAETTSPSNMHKHLVEQRKNAEKRDKKQNAKLIASGSVVAGSWAGLFAYASGAGAAGAALASGTSGSVVAGALGIVATSAALPVAAGTAAIGASAVGIVKVQRHNVDKELAGLQSLIDKEDDKDKKEKLQKKLDLYTKLHVDKNGMTHSRPSQYHLNRFSKEEKAEYEELSKNLKDNKKEIRSEGKKYIKEKGDSWKDKIQIIAKNASSNKSEVDDKKDIGKVVKDKDGSEIHPRAKKVGYGTTYVRIKNGKEIGYADHEDYQKAQQRKAKKANESFLSLTDYMMIN